jgi:hypothetical protein
MTSPYHPHCNFDAGGSGVDRAIYNQSGSVKDARSHHGIAPTVKKKGEVGLAMKRLLRVASSASSLGQNESGTARGDVASKWDVAEDGDWNSLRKRNFIISSVQRSSAKWLEI